MNAFLEDLEPDVQKTVKQQIAEAFFTKTDALPMKLPDGTQLQAKDFVNLVQQIIAKLK